MEQKTKVAAESGKQEIIITRHFDLPVDQLFNAYEEPALIEQWMGTRVLKLENRPHGSWQFETVQGGQVVFSAHGVIHDFVRGKSITRTFERAGSQLPAQLEFLEFEALTEDTSRLTMQMVFRSVGDRDGLLRLPFAQYLSAAHDRLQQILQPSK